MKNTTFKNTNEPAVCGEVKETNPTATIQSDPTRSVTMIVTFRPTLQQQNIKYQKNKIHKDNQELKKLRVDILYQLKTNRNYWKSLNISGKNLCLKDLGKRRQQFQKR